MRYETGMINKTWYSLKNETANPLIILAWS